MTVIDSSGWIEFFTDGPLADDYASRLRKLAAGHHASDRHLRGLQASQRELSEDDAVIAVSAMQRSQVVPIDQELALNAADLSLEHGLAMADALVLATARKFQAELVTSDSDFAQITGVTYLPKRSTGA